MGLKNVSRLNTQPTRSQMPAGEIVVRCGCLEIRRTLG